MTFGNRNTWFFSIVFGLLSLWVFVGCGGGTQGTGGITIDGTVQDSKGQTLSGIRVVLLNSNDSTVTDSQGGFSLYSETAAEYNISVESQGEQPTVTLSDVPPTATQIQIIIQISDNGSPTVGSLEVVAEHHSHGSSSSPTPTPSVGVSPTPTPNSTDQNESDDSSNPTPTPSPGNGGDDGTGQVDDGNTNPSPTPTKTATATPTPELSEKVRTQGALSQFTSSLLVVNGIQFTINRDTEFKNSQGKEIAASSIHIGDPVSVTGEYDRGVLYATLVRLTT